MHPDKNGGTEEAKIAFQNMKGYYEILKEKLQDEWEPEEDDTSAGSAHSPQRTGRKEAYDEDSPVDDGKGGGGKEKKEAAITYNPNDRSSMETALHQMVRQIRSVGLKSVEVEEGIRNFETEMGIQVGGGGGGGGGEKDVQVA